MGGIVDAISDAVSSVVDTVGDAIDWAADTAGKIVENALDHPVETALTIGVVAATGGAGAAALGLEAPLTALEASTGLAGVSGVSTLAQGGDLSDALTNAATTFAVSQGVNYVFDSFNTSGTPGEGGSGTTQFFDDGTSIQTFDDGSRLVTDTTGAVTPVLANESLTAGLQSTGAETKAVPTPDLEGKVFDLSSMSWKDAADVTQNLTTEFLDPQGKIFSPTPNGAWGGGDFIDVSSVPTNLPPAGLDVLPPYEGATVTGGTAGVDTTGAGTGTVLTGDDGSTLTIKPDGTVTSTAATDTGTGAGTVLTGDDGSTVTINQDGTVTSTAATDTGTGTDTGAGTGTDTKIDAKTDTGAGTGTDTGAGTDAKTDTVASTDTQTTTANTKTYDTMEDLLHDKGVITDAEYKNITGTAPVVDKSTAAVAASDVSTLDALKDLGKTVVDVAKDNPLTTAAVVGTTAALAGTGGDKSTTSTTATSTDGGTKSYTYGPGAPISRTGLQELWSAASKIYGGDSGVMQQLGIQPPAAPAFQSSFQPLLSGQAGGGGNFGLGALGQGFSYTPIGRGQTFDISTLSPEQIVQLQNAVNRKKTGEGA